MTNNVRQVTHLDCGFETACGKSLHGWNMYRPSNVAEKLRDVTCKRCIAACKRYEANEKKLRATQVT
jgi:hypothetical protein